MVRLRLLLPLALTFAVIIVPGTAFGAPPTLEHFRDVGTDIDPDFCGTGQAIDVAFDVRGNVWISPGGEDELVRTTVSGRIVFTNPETGDSVTLSFAGSGTDETISGDPEGLHTHFFTNRGLPEKLQTTNGPVLLRDAGFIAFTATLDGDEFISQETVFQAGPHPEADSDFELFCEVTTEALGIT